MFAAYWPVMAFVAAIVLVLAFLSLSLGKMCGARTEPLPERDLTTYLPEDVSIDIINFKHNETSEWGL